MSVRPVDKVVAALEAHGCNPRRSGDGWSARCPAHDDDNPSLTVSEGDDGRALVHCHAGDGCQTEAIVAAIGLTMADLFPEASTTVKAKPDIVATYDYVDEGGRLLFQVCRLVPKSFRQRRPKPEGGWKWKLGDVRKVPFRLPELLEAVAAGRWVVVVEGEKDVLTLAQHGIVATCNAGGAGKWPREFAAFLKGARVAVIPDNDPPGEKHAHTVASSLKGIAETVVALAPMSHEPGGDVTDWLLAQDDAAAAVAGLKDLIRGATVWEQPPDTAPESATDYTPQESRATAQPLPARRTDDELVPSTPADGHRYTDVGNGERLVAEHGAAFRWNATRGRWMTWDGRRWTDDHHGRIVVAAKATVRSMYRDAIETMDPDQRKKAVGWAMASESGSRIDAMVKLARSEPGMTVTDDDLDADGWLLNANNGVVDLHTGELLDHDPRRLITRLAPVDYDPSATAPLWDAFLERILPDPEVREFVARAIGYSVTGSTTEEVLLVAYGIGQNGKTRFLEAIKGAVGDYAMQAEPDLLLARRDAHPAGVAMLAGKRMVMATETDNGRRFAEATVKRLTGGDTITARQLYGNFFEFVPTHTIWMATNYRPEVRGTDEGIWRRLRIVPFEVQIPEEERDTTLGDKLAKEAPAILTWAIRACRRWQTGGLTSPSAVSMATNNYRAEMDDFGDFLDECCTTDETANDTAARLYGAYTSWATASGSEAMSQRGFGFELRRRGFDKIKDESSRRIRWIGLEAKEGAFDGVR